jgi:predicted transposase/invertase (TIGR01784 family)
VLVEVLNPDLPKEAVTNKGCVLDVRVLLADGRQINVEMQVGSQPGFRKRGVYYWTRMHGADLRAGMSYEQLQPCVSIFILGYKDLPSTRFHSTFQLLEIRDGERFSDQIAVHVVELPKLPKAGTARGDEPLLEDWGRFLAARSDQELEELAMSNPVIAKAKGALDFLSGQPTPSGWRNRGGWHSTTTSPRFRQAKPGCEWRRFWHCCVLAGSRFRSSFTPGSWRATTSSFWTVG